MTVTREELRRAASTSDDDGDRLVYADWLEQHGELAHAQVIHLQCEYARTGRFERRRLELQWELDVALAALGDRWQDDLPVLDGVEWLALERGLPAAVRVRDVEALRANAEAIAAAAPTVYRVELQRAETDPTPIDVPWLRVLRVAGPLGSNPVLALADELELAVGAYVDPDEIERDRPLARLALFDNADIDDEFVRALGAAPWAKGVKALHLPTSRAEQDQSYYDADPRLSITGGAALARLTALEVINIDRHDGRARTVERLLALPALRELSARENGVTKLALAKAKGAPLELLDLSANAIGTAGAQAIAKTPRLRQLQHLALDTCEIEGLGIVELIRAPLWDTLRRLDLSRNPLGAAAARALAEGPRPAQLHTLLLADADLDEAAGTALGKVAWLGALAQLDLSGNPLGRGAAGLRSLEGEGLRRLALASIGLERTEAALLARFWPRLVHLDVGGNPFGDAGLERFATMREAAALQVLSLHDCKLGDDGLELLAGARCPRLRTLDLAGNSFGPAGLAALLAAPLIGTVTSLSLARCTLGPEAIAVLARTPLPLSLARVDLRGNELGEAELLALADSPTLRTVGKLLLDGNPFVFDPRTRERLEQRFGATWYRD